MSLYHYTDVHRHKLSQLKSVPFLKSSRFAGTRRTPMSCTESNHVRKIQSD